MKVRNKILLVGLVLGLVICFVRSIYAETKPEIKVSGLVYADYGYVLSEYLADGTKSNNFNSFNIGRVYLNTEAKLTDKIKGFAQLEVNLISKEIWTAKEATNDPYLKQAWLEISICPNAKLTVGFVPVPWRGYEEKIWGHRFVAKILEDIEGLGFATDRGLRLSGNVLKYIEYGLAVLNGEGTKGNEINGYKDYQFMSAIEAPFLKGLKLNLFYQKGNNDKDQPRDRFFSGLSYESKRFNAMGTYYYAKGRGVGPGYKDEKGGGFSAHGFVNITGRNWVFARYDFFDPNEDEEGDAKQRIILGLGHRITEGVRVALDYQVQIREEETDKGKNVGAISCHLEAKF
jgi:hypothetical protein